MAEAVPPTIHAPPSLDFLEAEERRMGVHLQTIRMDIELAGLVESRYLLAPAGLSVKTIEAINQAVVASYPIKVSMTCHFLPRPIELGN